MKHGKNIIDRATEAKGLIRLRESEFTTPRQYLELKILLFDVSRVTWSDDDSEGREVIERFALDERTIKESCFAVCFAADGAKVTLADYSSVICRLTNNGLNILLPIADGIDVRTITGFTEMAVAAPCSFEYKTNGSNTDFVELTKEIGETKTIYHCRIKRITEITGITILPAYQIDRERLRNYCIQHTPVWQLRVYGVEHCDRVAENGQLLLEPGASINVIIAFAYLHDLERNSSETDPGHGNRAALLVDKIRYQYLPILTDPEIDLLKRACKMHDTLDTTTGNPTIDICLDADRLDLPRLGIIPSPAQMATEKGAQLAVELNSPVTMP